MAVLNGFQLRYYESVMDSIPCGTLALNSELVIASINPAAAHILGLTMQEAIGFPLPCLLNALLGPDGTLKLEVRPEVGLAAATLSLVRACFCRSDYCAEGLSVGRAPAGRDGSRARA